MPSREDACFDRLHTTAGASMNRLEKTLIGDIRKEIQWRRSSKEPLNGIGSQTGSPSGAKQGAEKVLISPGKPEKHTSGAEAHVDFIGFMPRPTAQTSFQQPVKPAIILGRFRHD